MVIPLGKFYGSSLPRPRYYTDIKFSDKRVDPPVSVLDPLMSWAEEAHWSMGGLSFNRLRLQGKIEGNVKKLKKEREVTWKKKMENEDAKSTTPVSRRGGESSPPHAPVSKKRKGRKFVDEEEEEFEDESSGGEEEEEIEIEKEMKLEKKRQRRRLVRKLGDDFEMVGDESVENGKTPSSNGGVSKGVAARTRSRRSMVLNDDEENEEEEVVVTKEKNVVKEKAKKVSEPPKKNGKRGSVSPASGTKRSSPRLKK